VAIPETSGALVTLVIIGIVSLNACAKQGSPPLAELPPSLPILARIGAIQTTQGWLLTFTDGHFHDGTFALQADDDRISKVVDILRNNRRLRVHITAYTTAVGSPAHARDLSQKHADAVFRALTARGADAASIQAEGRSDHAVSETTRGFTRRLNPHRVTLVFSDPFGDFPRVAPGTA
jgi:hypothetical protein